MLDCPPGRAIASHPTKSPGSNPGKTNIFPGRITWTDVISSPVAPLQPRPLGYAAGIRAGRLSVACDYLHQSIPARVALPMWSAVLWSRCSSRILKQPCHHRNKSGRRRPGRCTGRRDRKARRLHPACIHIALDFRLRRSGQDVRPPAEIHARRFHSDRASDLRAYGSAGQRPATLQDSSRSWSTMPRRIRTSSSSARPGFTALCICRPHCL